MYDTLKTLINPRGLIIFWGSGDGGLLEGGLIRGGLIGVFRVNHYPTNPPPATKNRVKLINYLPRKYKFPQQMFQYIKIIIEKNYPKIYQ